MTSRTNGPTTAQTTVQTDTQASAQATAVRPAYLLITETDLCGWLGQAAAGASLTYHRGSLARDRTRPGSPLTEADRLELDQVCRRVHWACDRKLVHLVQRRHGDDDYSYFVIARPRTKNLGASLVALLAGEAA